MHQAMISFFIHFLTKLNRHKLSQFLNNHFDAQSEKLNFAIIIENLFNFFPIIKDWS
jgi:hypothetical protein